MTVAWSLHDRNPDDIPVTAAPTDALSELPGWADATGAGVRVCVVDSGVEGHHPLVRPLAGAYAVVTEPSGTQVVPTEATDACGHGTACAGIIRAVAPECELTSVRVLGPGSTGTGSALLTGLEWAVEQRFDVINMSLSTTREKFAQRLRELADTAYFQGTAIVASAHNSPVESYPWRFSSVISVGSHRETDLDLHLYNPRPPVEYYAAGQNIEVAWPGGATIRTTGNSFATPRIAGLCARALQSRPRMTLFELKSALYLTAGNVSRAVRADARADWERSWTA